MWDFTVSEISHNVHHTSGVLHLVLLFELMKITKPPKKTCFFRHLKKSLLTNISEPKKFFGPHPPSLKYMTGVPVCCLTLRH